MERKFSISPDAVLDGSILTGPTPEEQDDFEYLEDLVSTAVLTGIEDKRRWAEEMIRREFEPLGWEMRVYTVEAGDETFAYLSPDGEKFIHVGTYPNVGPPPIEEALSRKMLEIYNPSEDPRYKV